MRVIAGKVKGRHLKFPKGTTTRPATDLVRGAIFSILENMTDRWDRVLDLFSGSGAMGIEALSRGAEWVDFVDREPRCCAIIKENLDTTGLAGQAHVYCSSVEKTLAILDKEYDIIVIDPPYADASIHSILEHIADSKLVGTETTVVVTHSSRIDFNQKYSSLNQVKEHRHGDSTIAVYRKEAQ